MLKQAPFDPYSINGSPYNFDGLSDHVRGNNVCLTDIRPPTTYTPQLLFPDEHKGTLSPDYLCLIFHGRRGRGKSTGATAFAKYLYDTNRAKNPDYACYANYKVDFAVTHPRLIDSLVNFPEWCHDCCIVVDEIAVFFPSVRATSTAALNFSSFLQEIRKLRVDLLFTTQFPTMIIGNASIQIDLFMEPHLYNKKYEPSVKRWVADSVSFDAVDWWGQWTGHPVRHRWPPEPQDSLKSWGLHNVRHVYKHFNTNEIIPPYWSGNRLDVIRREWREEFEAEEAEDNAREAREAERPSRVAKNFSTLRQLLEAQSEGAIPVGIILEDARKIDPQIKTSTNLVDAVRRLGWRAFKGGTRGSRWYVEPKTGQMVE